MFLLFLEFSSTAEAHFYVFVTLFSLRFKSPDDVIEGKVFPAPTRRFVDLQRVESVKKFPVRA